MSRPVIWTFAVLFSLSITQSSNAQQAAYGGTLQPRIVEGVSLAPPGGFFVGGYSGPGGTERQVVHFYTVRDPEDHNPEGMPYASIPMANRALENDDGRTATSWADGRSCPQLYGVLYEFSRLSPPLFHVRQLTAEPPGAARMGAGQMRVHAPQVSVWGYARQADGVPATMMITGTDGILDRWVRWSEDQLSGCWSSNNLG